MLSREGIFAHRGLWQEPREKNTFEALFSAADAGFSIETDILQDGSGIRVAHDYSDENPRLDLAKVLGIGRLALNIKSDAAWVVDDFSRMAIQNSGSFFFDGSNPVMFQVMRSGYRFANRISDIETPLALEAEVLWVDSLVEDFWFMRDAEALAVFQRYKTLVFVSPELHGRQPNQFWSAIRELDKQMPSSLELGICTDYPFELCKEFGL